MNPKRNRRVDRNRHAEARAPGIVATSPRYGIAENQLLGLLLALRTSPNQYLGRFLEVEQPKRQLKVLDADDVSKFSERARVLVMRVQQHDVRFRILFKDRRQNHRERARLPRTGRADDGKMLCKQLVGEDQCRTVWILIERADLNVRFAGLAVDSAQVGVVCDIDGCAGNRMDRHAAAKLQLAADAADLPQKVNDQQILRPPRALGLLLADDGDDRALSVEGLYQRADADRLFPIDPPPSRLTVMREPPTVITRPITSSIRQRHFYGRLALPVAVVFRYDARNVSTTRALHGLCPRPAETLVGLVFIDSGYNDLKSPDERSRGLGVPKGFAVFLGAAELLGGTAVVIGFLAQLAAIGLILIMLGAFQKKIFVWKTGFWGKDGLGWNYELILVSMLLVVLCTNGGRFVI